MVFVLLGELSIISEASRSALAGNFWPLAFTSSVFVGPQVASAWVLFSGLFPFLGYGSAALLRIFVYYRFCFSIRISLGRALVGTPFLGAPNFAPRRT